MSDLIKRSDAIKAIWGDDINPNEDGMVFESQSHIDRDIRLISSADRPQGEWIAQTENYHSHWVCSECGSWALLEYNEQMFLSNFCPNCGARMFAKDTNVPNKKE